MRRPSLALVVAALALFVALGGPSWAAETAGLAKNSVTSATVKDGSLAAKDLSKKARTTLTTTPAGSVTTKELAPGVIPTIPSTLPPTPGSVNSAAVSDGGLASADIGRFTGTIQDLDFGSIVLGDCKTISSVSLTAIRANEDLTDDAIVVTPPQSFPQDAFSVYAQPGPTALQIAVTVCNISGANPANVGPVDFRYVTFG